MCSYLLQNVDKFLAIVIILLTCTVNDEYKGLRIKGVGLPPCRSPAW